MNRSIIERAEQCERCTEYGKNLKTLQGKQHYASLPALHSPNEEVQLDFAGPLFGDNKNKKYLLVAIDRYSKFPSIMITNTTDASKVIKFLREYIALHGVPKTIRTDQFSSFKSKQFKKFCSAVGITQLFCPINDHRGCGLVERSIQTIKRRLGVCLHDNKMTYKNR